jgi:hypothetical protein
MSASAALRAPTLALRHHALPREEDQNRRHDREVRQERIGLPECLFTLSLHDDVLERGIDRVHHAEGVAVDVRRAGGELPQHDGREPRACRRLLDDSQDPGIELVLGGAGTVGNGARARPDRAEHAAEHLDVQPQLAAVVVVEHRLVDMRLRGDAVDAGGVVAALGELERGGPDDGGRGLGAAGTSAVNQPVS